MFRNQRVGSSAKEMSIEDFIKYAEGINNIDFAAAHGREMNFEERAEATAAKRAVRHLQEYKKIISNIVRETGKYTDKYAGRCDGSEAYVIWRLAELSKDQYDYSGSVIHEHNYIRFGRSDRSVCRSLPTDLELIEATDALKLKFENEDKM